MSVRVRSGDPENMEAQAARRYWHAVFGDEKFRRGNDAQNQNRHLDYGYIVLRAVAARALCARDCTLPSACITRTVTTHSAWRQT